jgi:hypothetical protein
VLAGVGVKGDITKLRKHFTEFEEMVCFDVAGEATSKGLLGKNCSKSLSSCAANFLERSLVYILFV